MSTQVGSATLTFSSTGRAGSGPRILLIASVALILLIAAVRAPYCWATDAWVNHPAGVLIAMAADLKDGVFYRPLYGPEGYGGTRYFPLYFVLHALLMKLGVPILPGAFLLSAAAVVALLAGVFYLLRGLGVEPWLAACSAGAVLAAGCAQYSLVSPHADGLASALNVWGLAVSVRAKLTHRKILLAAVLFTLAWSAKITTVFGFAAAFVWLMSTGFRAGAWEMAGETCFGYLVVGVAMVVGSQGRVVEIFKACVSGGTGLAGFAAGPWNMVVQAARLDPAVLLFVFLALVVLAQVVFSGKFLQNLPALFFVAVLAVTAMIFGSPGVNENHLLDVQVASVVLIASWLANATVPLQQAVGNLRTGAGHSHGGGAAAAQVQERRPEVPPASLPEGSRGWSATLISQSCQRIRSSRCSPGSSPTCWIPGCCACCGVVFPTLGSRFWKDCAIRLSGRWCCAWQIPRPNLGNGGMRQASSDRGSRLP